MYQTREKSSELSSNNTEEQKRTANRDFDSSRKLAEKMLRQMAVKTFAATFAQKSLESVSTSALSFFFSFLFFQFKFRSCARGK